MNIEVYGKSLLSDFLLIQLEKPSKKRDLSLSISFWKILNNDA